MDNHEYQDVRVLLNVTQRTSGRAPLDLVKCEEQKTTLLQMHSALLRSGERERTRNDIMKAIGVDSNRYQEVCVLLNVTQRIARQPFSRLRHL